ncbi:MAG: type II toxin-antitoxin system death-on-curing family toxin [Acidobacteria bacterium]|nr:type II toxin-antitoxin system death-on-curing family toxin [Acidobacteriota bacterium]MBA3785743.1 type II toxin-antitoxin system death-on-curing family toxin [Acidobacteriota bacterium]MBA4185460.1 type II toxin-antitoxin system death-on-curing family toxin [Acidobacteriota bacterium]
MIFPDKSAVLEIQSQLIERYGGIHGLRDEGALESALNAAENRAFYEDAPVDVLAATYAFHLSQAHAFLDGNKRIAAAVTGVFLELNGAWLNASQDEIIELFLDIAASRITREVVESKFAEWIIFAKENNE